MVRFYFHRYTPLSAFSILDCGGHLAHSYLHTIFIPSVTAGERRTSLSKLLTQPMEFVDHSLEFVIVLQSRFYTTAFSLNTKGHFCPLNFEFYCFPFFSFPFLLSSLDFYFVFASSVSPLIYTVNLLLTLFFIFLWFFLFLRQVLFYLVVIVPSISILRIFFCFIFLHSVTKYNTAIYWTFSKTFQHTAEILRKFSYYLWIL